MKLAILDSNFQRLENKETIACDLKRIIDRKLGGASGEEAFLISRLKACVRLIHHTGDAPVLLGALYTVLRLVGERSSKVLGGFQLGLIILKRFAYWLGYEKYRLLGSHDPELNYAYDKLAHEITYFHKIIIYLLAHMLLQFDENISGKS